MGNSKEIWSCVERAGGELDADGGLGVEAELLAGEVGLWESRLDFPTTESPVSTTPASSSTLSA